MDRRAFLGTAAAGLCANLLPVNSRAGDLLAQPPEIRSHAGVLNATLTAAAGPVNLGNGVTFPGFLYNGAYLPPLLRARTGDILRIRFRNRLPQEPSNLHFHGLSVSPGGNSDNVFVHVHPGAEFDYEVRIPAHGSQGPGLFWYHPHAHGVVNAQIVGGLSGGLLIEGFEQYFPLLAELPERFLFIKHAQIDGRELVSINGQVNPVVTIRPGEVQFWRIGHIGATLFVKFRVEGVPLYLLATDGRPLLQPQRLDELFVGPGERREVLVIGPPAGTYAMRTISFQNEAWRAPEPAQQIATIVSSGAAMTGQPNKPQILSQSVRGRRWIEEVRTAAIARRRLLTYSRTADRRQFMIDGRVMDEGRIDQIATLGTTEQWTIVNTDAQFHSFHIHQTPFLVTQVNGVACASTSLRDTFPVPPATEIGPSSLTVAIPFTDPVIRGKFVYHCHAVDHEDKGMMGVIEVRE